jgi:hypothetical protein
MVAGAAVHQGIVLLETDFFKSVKHTHLRLNLKGEILVAGGIDPVRFVAQDSDCNGFGFHGFNIFYLDPGEINAKEISQGRQDI